MRTNCNKNSPNVLLKSARRKFIRKIEYYFLKIQMFLFFNFLIKYFSLKKFKQILVLRYIIYITLICKRSNVSTS